MMAQSPFSPTYAQRRVSFNPVNESMQQPIPRQSPTLYIIPPTLAPDKQTLLGYGRVSLQPDHNNEGFVHVTTRGHHHIMEIYHDVHNELEASHRSYAGKPPYHEESVRRSSRNDDPLHRDVHVHLPQVQSSQDYRAPRMSGQGHP